jgi:hypothetical protein
MKEKIEHKSPERKNPNENWEFSIKIGQNLTIINFSFLSENSLKYYYAIKIQNPAGNIDTKIIQEAIERVLNSNPQIKERFSGLLVKTLGLTRQRKDVSSHEQLEGGLSPEQLFERFRNHLELASENELNLLTEQSQAEIKEALRSLGTPEERAKIREICQILESFLGLIDGKTEIISEGLIQKDYLQKILDNIKEGNIKDALARLISAISNSLKNKNLILPDIIFLDYIHPTVAAVAYYIVEELSKKSKINNEGGN